MAGNRSAMGFLKKLKEKAEKGVEKGTELGTEGIKKGAELGTKEFHEAKDAAKKGYDKAKHDQRAPATTCRQPSQSIAFRSVATISDLLSRRKPTGCRPHGGIYGRCGLGLARFPANGGRAPVNGGSDRAIAPTSPLRSGRSTPRPARAGATARARRPSSSRGAARRSYWRGRAARCAWRK